MPWANGFTSALQKDVVFPASYFGGSLDDQNVWINKGVGRVRLFLSVCCPPADCNTAAVLSVTLLPERHFGNGSASRLHCFTYFTYV